jgi:hypothetical protein
LIDVAGGAELAAVFVISTWPRSIGAEIDRSLGVNGCLTIAILIATAIKIAKLIKTNKRGFMLISDGRAAVKINGENEDSFSPVVVC